ncbi:hypothetical protein BDP27DRAFT_663952 [Rhodocollybia butyracea]|uniref:Uncharacterized protein n=1 Tax=Rhodocollybia butyracea TaxID=206335 RepID=A0A9P5U8D0_9AGAR|nr:hypothetical protein BDP27DRAFT_663952 [Rhodocollybia butyracea]
MKRGRGRPKGSKNKKNSESGPSTPSVPKKRGRPPKVFLYFRSSATSRDSTRFPCSFCFYRSPRTQRTQRANLRRSASEEGRPSPSRHQRRAQRTMLLPKRNGGDLPKSLLPSPVTIRTLTPSCAFSPSFSRISFLLCNIMTHTIYTTQYKRYSPYQNSLDLFSRYL